MSSWSSTGASAADRCGSPAPLLLIPGMTSTGRSSEEIWKDINLSFLKEQDHHCRGHLSAAENCLGDFPGGVLCDGFPGLNRGPSPVSHSLASPTALPDSATCLSLYWTPADSNHPVPHPPKPIDKRGPKNASSTDFEDKRRKRLMKNRESADRSRARKQAYTNELENEVAILRKENAWLRSQQEKVPNVSFSLKFMWATFVFLLVYVIRDTTFADVVGGSFGSSSSSDATTRKEQAP